MASVHLQVVAMKFIVIYDISSNSVRSKVSRHCKDFGLKRVQKSAFSGELTLNCAQMLAIKCKGSGLEESDCVFIIPSCDSCFAKKEIIGTLDEKALEKPELMVV